VRIFSSDGLFKFAMLTTLQVTRAMVHQTMNQDTVSVVVWMLSWIENWRGQVDEHRVWGGGASPLARCRREHQTGMKAYICPRVCLPLLGIHKAAMCLSQNGHFRFAGNVEATALAH
jgi:hypothetical protein